MVYTAASRELAALEFFRNLDAEEARDDLLICEAMAPDGLIEVVDMAAKAGGWVYGGFSGA